MEIRPGFIRRKTFSRALPGPGLCGMQDSGTPAPNPPVFLPPGLKTQKIWDPKNGSHIFLTGERVPGNFSVLCLVYEQAFAVIEDLLSRIQMLLAPECR